MYAVQTNSLAISETIVTANSSSVLFFANISLYASYFDLEPNLRRVSILHHSQYYTAYVVVGVMAVSRASVQTEEGVFEPLRGLVKMEDEMDLSISLH